MTGVAIIAVMMIMRLMRRDTCEPAIVIGAGLHESDVDEAGSPVSRFMSHMIIITAIIATSVQKQPCEIHSNFKLLHRRSMKE